MKLLYILLTALSLQISFPSYRPDSTYLAQDPYKIQSQTYNGLNKETATNHKIWVWCDVCHKHLPLINGKMYNWNDNMAVNEHEHQNGYVEDLPIDEDQKGMVILIVIALLWCAITTFCDPKLKDTLHNSKDSKYDDC